MIRLYNAVIEIILSNHADSLGICYDSEMSKSKRKPGRPVDPNSKRSRGEPRTSKLPKKTFHLPEELNQAFDRYMAEQKPPRSTESEALRTFLAEALAARGYWKME